MTPLIIIVVPILIILALLLTPYRQGVLDFLEVIVNFVCRLIPAILLIITVIILLVILLGVSWVSMWTTLGDLSQSVTAGWIIGIGSIIAACFSFTRKWVLPILLIAGLIMAIGFCFPTAKGAMNRYSQGSENQFANALDSATLQKQPLGVATGVVIKNAILRDENGIPTSTVAKTGKKIKTLSLEGKQFKDSPDVFVYVMLEDANEEFVSGKRGWIARDKLRLSNKEPSPLARKDPPQAGPDNKTASKYLEMFSLNLSQTPAMPELARGEWKASAPISIEAIEGGPINKTSDRTFILTGVKTKVLITTPQNMLVKFEMKPLS